jgi:hypothetical protein
VIAQRDEFTDLIRLCYVHFVPILHRRLAFQEARNPSPKLPATAQLRHSAMQAPGTSSWSQKATT